MGGWMDVDCRVIHYSSYPWSCGMQLFQFTDCIDVTFGTATKGPNWSRYPPIQAASRSTKSTATVQTITLPLAAKDFLQLVK